MLANLKNDAGAGPPLLYVPGIDGSGELLLGTAEVLEQRFRLIRVSYEAEVPPLTADRYHSLAESISMILDRLGVERVIVLAESFGGAVALQLALDDPERVQALAIVNSFVRYRRRLKLAFSRLAAEFTPDFVYRRARYLAPWGLLAAPRDPDVVARFRAVGGIRFDNGYRRRMRMIQGLDLRGHLAEVQQPVALFAADRDRVVDSVAAARDMERRLPNATLEILPGQGHMVLPLREQRWESRLARLLERVS